MAEYRSVYTSIFTSGWDSGAISVAQLKGNGGYTWQVGQSIGIVCGLNNNETGPHYQDVNYGFYVEDSRTRIVESGEFKTNFEYFNKETTVFKIERLDTLVYYYLDDTLIYTSLIPSSGVVFLDCSMYHYDDAIYDAEIYYLDDTVTDLNINLKPLAAFGIETGEELTHIDIEISALTCEAEQTIINEAEIDLCPIIAFGSESDVNIISAELLPLVASGEDLVPSYNEINISLESLVAIGWESKARPESDIEIEPLMAFGSDVDANLSAIDLEPLAVEVFETIYNYMQIYTFPPFSMEISSVAGFYGDVTFSRFRVSAGDLNFGDISFPSFEVEGNILGNISGDIVFPNLAAFGGDLDPSVLSNFILSGNFGGDFDETLKGFVVEGSITSFYEFSAEITMPGLAVVGDFGGNAEIETNSFEVEGRIFLTGDFSGDMLLRNLEMVGDITYGLLGSGLSADIDFPRPVVSGQLLSDSDFYLIQYINPRSVKEQAGDVSGDPEYILGYDR